MIHTERPRVRSPQLLVDPPRRGQTHRHPTHVLLALHPLKQFPLPMARILPSHTTTPLKKTTVCKQGSTPALHRPPWRGGVPHPCRLLWWLRVGTVTGCRMGLRVDRLVACSLWTGHPGAEGRGGSGFTGRISRLTCTRAVVPSSQPLWPARFGLSLPFRSPNLAPGRPRWETAGGEERGLRVARGRGPIILAPSSRPGGGV